MSPVLPVLTIEYQCHQKDYYLPDYFWITTDYFGSFIPFLLKRLYLADTSPNHWLLFSEKLYLISELSPISFILAWDDSPEFQNNNREILVSRCERNQPLISLEYFLALAQMLAHQLVQQLAQQLTQRLSKRVSQSLSQQLTKRFSHRLTHQFAQCLAHELGQQLTN